MEASTPFSNIPNDIIRHMFLQLPMKFVIRCQCVCKLWRSLIDDSDFKLLYRGQRRVVFLSHEYSTRPDSGFEVKSTSHDLRLQTHKFRLGEAYPYHFRVLCSCNGFAVLVVIREIWLWNPTTTRCSKKVLESPYPARLNPNLFGGLCYDPCTRDYKVVLSLRPIKPDHDYGYPLLISASLNHKEWRPVQFPCNLVSARGGIEFRNTFHWWASDIKDWDRDRDYLWAAGRNRIVYFDPVHDEFRILPTPELGRGRENSIVGLGVIDECLCMASFMVREGDEPNMKTIQVLIMKEYGKQESWMIAFALRMPHYLENIYDLTFYSQKKNAQEVLFLHTAGRCGPEIYVYDRYELEIYVYDREKNKLKEGLMDFLTSSNRYYTSECFYVESFASPDRPQ
nr:F-box/kelch-repeat protein At3g23880-like [Ipomoea batatas]